jgi:hypothetical protein
LAQKTIFVVSQVDFQTLNDIFKSRDQTKSATKPATSQQNEDDNFDKVFARELINYGNFHPAYAKKILETEGLSIEKKTEKLTQLCKQAKEGILDLEDDSMSFL